MSRLSRIPNRNSAAHRGRCGSLSASATVLLSAVALSLGFLGVNAALADRYDRPALLSMQVGQSQVLRCARMRRVAVVDAKVADVAVASSRELLILAKGVGKTDIYIWDEAGFRKIELSVIDVTPSEKAAEQLRPLLGPDCRLVALTDRALAVEGVAKDAATLERIKSLCASVDGDVKIVNLVTLVPEPPRAPPLVEPISEVLGSEYKVWAVNGDTVAVEGRALNSQEAARVRALLDAFRTQTNVVDLIQEPAPPARSIEDERVLVADAVGDGVSVRTVGGQAIALEGTLPSEAAGERIAQILDALDLQAPVLSLLTVAAPDKQQLLIRVKVVEVNRQEFDRLGVNWGHVEGTDTSQGGQASVSFFDQPFLFGQVNRTGFNQLLDFGVQLNLLIEKNKARILAEPNILVNDGEEASILVGGEVPIPVPQAGIAGAAAITIEYKEFGVRLQVTPSIVGGTTDDPKIHMSVTPEVSSIDPASSITVSGLSVPGFRTRRAETTVTVVPGDTLAIAGLLQRDIARTVRKIPILGDIPIIGNLFKSKQFTEGRTDLIIMVTPEIYAKDEDGGGDAG